MVSIHHWVGFLYPSVRFESCCLPLVEEVLRDIILDIFRWIVMEELDHIKLFRYYVAQCCGVARNFHGEKE